jgi:hypothetical protein
MITATVLGDTWRFGVTLLVLGVLTAFWHLVVTNLTPFPGTTGTPSTPDAGGAEKFPRIRRFTVVADVVLFVWIVAEGAIVIPFMFIEYGLH